MSDDYSQPPTRTPAAPPASLPQAWGPSDDKRRPDRYPDRYPDMPYNGENPDTVDWRQVEPDGKTCWSHQGKYLGKCLDKRMVGRPYDQDPEFSFEHEFENEKPLSGLFLKFTKSDCEVPVRQLVNYMNKQNTVKPTGGRKYKKNSIKRKRHSKKNKYTKSKKLKTSKKHYKK